MNIAIFLPNWVGDMVLATPAVRALRRHYSPPARLVGVVRPYVADVLAGTDWLDEMILYDPRSADRTLRGWSVAAQLRAARIDSALLLTHSFRTALVAWMGGARRRVGYARNGRGPLLTQKLYHRRARRRFIPTPVLDDYLRLAYAMGCATESRQTELATTPADELAADTVWRACGFAQSEHVVAMNAGGAFGEAKHWPAEYFGDLARRVAESHRTPVLVLCGPHERDIARQIEAIAAHPRVRSLADERLSIGLSRACVRRSRLLVTTDSGPRHFAAAFGVPAVTLFGPTHPAWSENYHVSEIHLQHELPCGPCQKRSCPLGHHRCMRELSVDEVFAAVERQLNGPRATLWIEEEYRPLLRRAELATFDSIMSAQRGELLRARNDRENWRLDLPGPSGGLRPAFLKKHRSRGVRTWLRAHVGAQPGRTPGRTEAENIARLAAVGLAKTRLVAFGERLARDGRLESFVVTEELTGFTQLDHFLEERFDARAPGRPSARDRDRARLIGDIAATAKKFHALGFNHRDLYCCHFFVREAEPGRFDVNLIDLERVERRRSLRRRWIVKDLAQLAYSAPRGSVGCTDRMAFIKHYLGVRRLRASDKRLIRRVLAKERWMRQKRGLYS